MDKGSINEKWTKEKQMWVDLEMISPGAVVSTKLWIAPQWLVWVNYYITATTLGACSAPAGQQVSKAKRKQKYTGKSRCNCILSKFWTAHTWLKIELGFLSQKCSLGFFFLFEELLTRRLTIFSPIYSTLPGENFPHYLSFVNGKTLRTDFQQKNCHNVVENWSTTSALKMRSTNLI